ncbi:MAG: hypothetical protein NVV57_04240 [Demequina sp.]|nr:hypothetical protein [Demequina sp.]
MTDPAKNGVPDELSVEELLRSSDHKIAAERLLLEAAANNIKRLQGHEDEPLRWFADLKFFILQVDFDITTLIAALLRHPNSRLTMEKFVALLVFETESDVGKIANGLQRSLRNPDAVTAKNFDGAKVTAALDDFKVALRPLRDDTGLRERLGIVRNTMAGHVWDGKGTRVNGSALWALSRPANGETPDAVLRDEFVKAALTLTRALGALAADLEDGFSVATHA